MSLEAAEQAVREADLDAALQLLQEQVRARPADAALRIFLFQLLCVLGQWDRALTQLNVAAELDAEALAMAQMYREALAVRGAARRGVRGKKAPMVFGEPDEWLALLIESLLVRGTAASRSAPTTLRARAFERRARVRRHHRRPAVRVDRGRRHAARARCCEAIINGRYYWVPFSAAGPHRHRGAGGPARRRVDAGALRSSRTAARPWRDPDALSRAREAGDDSALRLGRKTEWREAGARVSSRARPAAADDRRRRARR